MFLLITGLIIVYNSIFLCLDVVAHVSNWDCDWFCYLSISSPHTAAERLEAVASAYTLLYKYVWCVVSVWICVSPGCEWRLMPSLIHQALRVESQSGKLKAMSALSQSIHASCQSLQSSFLIFSYLSFYRPALRFIRVLAIQKQTFSFSIPHWPKNVSWQNRQRLWIFYSKMIEGIHCNNV